MVNSFIERKVIIKRFGRKDNVVFRCPYSYSFPPKDNQSEYNGWLKKLTSITFQGIFQTTGLKQSNAKDFYKNLEARLFVL